MGVDKRILEVDKRVLSVKSTTYYVELLFLGKTILLH